MVIRSRSPSLDFGGARNPDGQGFAAFGQVVAGMETVQGIHSDPAMAEKLDDPVAFRQVYATGGYSDWCEMGSDGFIVGPRRPAASR